MKVPPPSEWMEFENLCRDLWERIWDDRNIQKVGRSGQAQGGVDIFGHPDGGKDVAGIQCKYKDPTARRTIDNAEVADIVETAKLFAPRLVELIIATTTQRDQKIQEYARMISLSHDSLGLFSVSVWFWEDIYNKLSEHIDLVKKYYPDLFIATNPSEAVQETPGVSPDQFGLRSGEIRGLTDGDKDRLRPFIAGIYSDQSGEYSAQLEQVKRQLDEFNPEQALKQVRELKIRIWDSANNIIRYKILTVEGSALFLLRRENEAAALLIEAYQYNPTEERAIVNLAIAYSVLGNREKSLKLIEEIIERNPANPNIYILQIEQCDDSEPLERVLNSIPIEYRSLPEVAFALGILAFRRNDLSMAETQLRIAVSMGLPANPFHQGALGDIIVKGYTDDPRFSLPGEVTGDVKARLTFAIECLSKAWKRLSNSDLRERNISWLINRSIAWSILSEDKKADQDLILASAIAPDDIDVIRQRALNAYRHKAYQEAIQLFTPLKNHRSVPEAVIVIADCLSELGRNAEAISLLEDSLTLKLSDRNNKNVRSLLIQVYLKSGNDEMALSVANQFQATHPESLEGVILQAQVAKNRGKREDAVSFLKQGLQVIDATTDYYELINYADELFGLGEYEHAAFVYRRVVRSGHNNRLTYRLVYSLYRSGEYAEALSICESLRSAHGLIRYCLETESYILEKIGDLKKAAEKCFQYLELYPADHRFRLRLASIEMRNGNLDDVNHHLDIIDPSDLPVENRLQLLTMYALVGRSTEAIKLGYETRRQYFDSPDAHLQYISLLLTVGSEEEVLKPPASIMPNSVVFLTPEMEDREFYIIEERPDAAIEKREVGPGHPISEKLLGKYVGETVALSENPIEPHLQRILEVKNKYIHALHESLALYDKLFPNHGGILRFHIPTDSPEATKDKLKTILKSTKGDTERFRQIENYYRAGYLTIGMVSNLVKRDMLEVYSSFSSNPEVGIIAARGSATEREDAQILLQTENVELVVDITALFSIQALGIGELLRNNYGILKLPQATRDVLREISSMRSFTHTRERFTIGIRDGELWKSEVSPEDSQKRAKHLEELSKWVDAHCEILPCKELLARQNPTHREISEILGSSNYHTLLLARERHAVLFSDDLALRMLGQNEYGVRGVWTQAILQHARRSGDLDVATYHRYIVNMVKWNYLFTSIESGDLVEAARQAGWIPAHPYTEVAQNLSGRRSDDSALSVAAIFLYDLWNQAVTPRNREYFVISLLESLTYRRGVQRSADGLENAVRNRFRLLPLAEDQIISIINTWKRSRMLSIAP